MQTYIAYSMVNMYMAGIHAGIQAAHSICELSLKQFREELAGQSEYADDSYCRWLVDDKTIVIKNGGDAGKMLELLQLCVAQEKFGYASFQEPGLGTNVTTAITVIMPDLRVLHEQYEVAGSVVFDEFTKEEMALINHVNRLRLA